MDKPAPHHPDWTLIRAFLAVADTGSLSAAARRLGQSQPTLGRQIKQLEHDLGLTLFERHKRGLSVTEAGEGLIDPARRMQASAAHIALAAAGQDAAIAGTVRITASDVMARHVLPPILARLRIDEPEIQIELVPSDSSENLLFREADIAVRMYRSAQLDVITRQIGHAPLGIFAAQSYAERRGLPTRPEDLFAHDIVGYDRSEMIVQAMRAMGFAATRETFAVRCDDQNTYWELVRQGCGIGFTQILIGEADPLMTRVLPDLPIGDLPIWLAAPEAMRSTPRIRRVWDALETGLTQAFTRSTPVS